MTATDKPQATHSWRLRFGRAVAIRRHELDLSQEQLAFKSGLHRTYIGSLERGQRNPTLTTAARIAQSLEMSLSELISRVEQIQD